MRYVQQSSIHPSIHPSRHTSFSFNPRPSNSHTPPPTNHHASRCPWHVQAIAASSRGKLVSNAPLLSPMVFVLVSMLSTAYIAHYNAPKFYSELEGKSMAKLNKVTYTSFAFCAALFVFMMGAGFLTFGANSQGLILNNYAEQDMLAKACRLAIGSSILFGYPLTFVGARDGVLSLLGVSQSAAFIYTSPRLAQTSFLIPCISLSTSAHVPSMCVCRCGNRRRRRRPPRRWCCWAC